MIKTKTPASAGHGKTKARSVGIFRPRRVFIKNENGAESFDKLAESSRKVSPPRARALRGTPAPRSSFLPLAYIHVHTHRSRSVGKQDRREVYCTLSRSLRSNFPINRRARHARSREIDSDGWKLMSRTANWSRLSSLLLNRGRVPSLGIRGKVKGEEGEDPRTSPPDEILVDARSHLSLFAARCGLSNCYRRSDDGRSCEAPVSPALFPAEDLSGHVERELEHAAPTIKSIKINKVFRV